ncbi:unnamed protein product [Sympodiomycopsis kandeliae]
MTDHLPNELVLRILETAAWQDTTTAHTLAYVSKAACKVTAHARWHTVVLLSKQSQAYFLRTLTYADSRRLSLPDQSSTPAHYVRHLFLDFPFQQDTYSAPYKHDDPAEPVADLLRRCTSLTHLSIEIEALNLLILTDKWPKIHIDEMTITYHGSGSARDRGHGFFGNFLNMFTGQLNQVKRLHVIGIDPQSDLTGMEIPYRAFDYARAGSASRIVTSREDPLNGFTHLRYDTRRFALRPASITARRLRPFLQELALAGRPRLAHLNSNGGDPSHSSSSFTYTGRRHAAPERGSGLINQGDTHLSSTSVHDDPSEEASLLRSWGVGSFQHFHIAWNPPSDTAAPTSADEELGTSSGGWPKESHDVWTNTNLHNPQDVSDTFLAELQESLWELYGWSSPTNSSLLPISDDGNYLSRIPLGFDRMDRERLESIQRKLDSQTTTRIVYGVRPPANVFRLGGIGAFTREERLKLFIDRSKGGKGAWEE